MLKVYHIIWSSCQIWKLSMNVLFVMWSYQSRGIINIVMICINMNFFMKILRIFHIGEQQS